MEHSTQYVIETSNLTKEFLGFVAVNDVNLKVKRHTIHAIIGPNGAGKSTCFNLITKFLTPTTGKILFNGNDITGHSSSQIAREGIVRSFQISAVFPHMTVLENVRIGLQRRLGTTFHFWKSDKTLDILNDRVLDALEKVGLADFAHEQAVNLPYGRKRALEIATTVAMNPEVMLLDEPTQGMGHEDVERVTELIRKVAEGRTVIMVEHNMKVVSNIADTISVLQRGELIAEGNYETVSNNPQVMEAYMGSADTELQGH
ncbi:ABC transporter ATP-binding protein [Orrella daihaiensis]|uniref:ABC transporter ATP-binding protein n=1 Tax=Orrella daihaiensis TaxID=2782176 RepID=A0ABY4AHY9_9BURK|nr:ABC transporter ATP-binding protein [Orrella daihaiensis]UOD49907.1 ABC transporter ATP-binding protein [Orrella daihaiensis]